MELLAHGLDLIAQSNPPAPGPSDFLQKVLAAVIGASVGGALGFLAGLYLDRRKAKREPLEQISFDQNVRSWRNLVPAVPELKKKLRVNYDDVSIESLYVVSFIVENTGNRSVKQQNIKFSFPEGTRVLDTYLDPKPDDEVGLVVDRKSSDDSVRRYSFEHFGIGERIGFHFIATGDKVPEPRPRLGGGDKSDARLVERGALKFVDDSKHIQPFLIKVLSFIFLSASLSALGNLPFPFRYVFFLLWLPLQIGVLILLVPDIAPVTRLSAELVRQLLAKGSRATPAAVNVGEVGGTAQVVINTALGGGGAVVRTYDRNKATGLDDGPGLGTGIGSKVDGQE